MQPITREEIEKRLAKGQSLRSIARHFGVSHQALCWRRDHWGCKRMRKGRIKPSSTGRFIDQWGYIMVRTSNRAGALAYTPEHVIVAEKMLGRKLNKGERVHHINGMKDDNNQSNLFVFENQQAHKCSHADLERLALEMVRDGRIVFHDGIYSWS